MNEPPSDVSFTLREIFGETLASLRDDWRAHLGWNVIWVGSAFVSCCGTTAFAGGIGGVLGLWHHDSAADSGTRDGEDLGAVALIYAVILPLMLGLYAVHQAVTMAIADARARGKPISMRDGIGRGFSRTPAFVGHCLLRLVLEGVPLSMSYAVVFGILWSVVGTRGVGVRELGAAGWSVLGVGYVAVLVVAFALRGFIGLAFPIVVAGTGPVAAFGASIRLLRGRRWQFIGKRLAMLGLWMIAYGSCVGPVVWLASARFVEHQSPLGPLVAVPLMLAFYGVALAMVVFDAALEAVFHARVTRTLDAVALAATFD